MFLVCVIVFKVCGVKHGVLPCSDCALGLTSNLKLYLILVAGSDYVAGPLQATFPTSSMEGATSCVNISILQDMVLEGDHTFGVEVSSVTPSVVIVGMPSEETVTILDDESRCTDR